MVAKGVGLFGQVVVIAAGVAIGWAVGQYAVSKLGLVR